MKIKLAAAVLFGIVFLSPAALVFCQPETAPSGPSHPKTMPAPPGEDEGISWVWGEVKGVDPGASMLTVTYMDYQTDEEKELVLTVDPETEFEGVKDLGEVKLGDTASIDYILKDDKNIAKNISIEEMEAMPEAPVSPEAEGAVQEEAVREPLPEQKAQ